MGHSQKKSCRQASKEGRTLGLAQVVVDEALATPRAGNI